MNLILGLIALGEREQLRRCFTERQKHIAVTLRRDGTLVSLSLREEETWLPFNLPRTSGLRPNVLFDSAKYVFEEGRAVSLDLHRRLMDRAPKHPGVRAVVSFLENERPLKTAEQEALLKKHPVTLVYYLEGNARPICEDPALSSAIEDEIMGSFRTSEVLPMYGQSPCIADAHPKVRPPGLENEQALITMDEKLAPIVPFGAKDRMLQAPMGLDAVLDFTAALRFVFKSRLLRKWDVSPLVVSHFMWTETPHPFEERVQEIFRGPPKGMPMEEWRKALLEIFDGTDIDLPCHILALGAGSNRVAVRDYQVLPMRALAQHLKRYLEDFRGYAPWVILDQPLCKHLLHTVMVEKWMSAILFGRSYPKIPYSWHTLDQIHTALDDARASSQDRFRAFLAWTTLQAVEQFPMDLHHNVMYLAGKLFGAYLDLNYRAKDRSDSPVLRQSKTFVARYPVQGFAHRVLPRVEVFLGKRSLTPKNNEGRYIEDLWSQIEAGGGLPERSTAMEQIFFHQGFLAYRRERRERFDVEAPESPAIDVDNDPDLI